MEQLLTSLGVSNAADLNLGSLTLAGVLGAVVTLIICLITIKIVMSIFRKLLTRPSIDERVRGYALGGIRTVLWIIAILIVADSLGIPVTSLVAMLSVFTLAVSLAVQSVLSNIAGGIVILLNKPFKEGDYVDTPNGAGTVAKMTLSYTYLDTPDNLRVVIPNSALSAGKVVNYTALGKRRVDHTITASYDASVEDVRRACLEAVARTAKVMADPAPVVLVASYGESSISYYVRMWCDCADYWDVYFESLENIRACFAESSVEMTYNHLNVHIVEK
ncbi:MAG: mechanosensitive ion channel family protein [Ruminococcaceae bacterium]|nr:mechanosensitive ion channel family protein [Oscillospiraceae bacterium]